MSKTTKRKHVTKEILEDYYIPENEEKIAKVMGGRGNNLHEVEVVGGIKYLVSMPTKFRKNIWIKRGDFVVISPIQEGNKVKGEIVSILYPKQIKYLKAEKLWPEYFQKPKLEEEQQVLTTPDSSHGADASASDEDDGIFENPNHRPVYRYEDEEETDSEEEEEEENENDEEGNDDEDNGSHVDQKLLQRIEKM